jgi:hypothetical protein
VALVAISDKAHKEGAEPEPDAQWEAEPGRSGEKSARTRPAHFLRARREPHPRPDVSWGTVITGVVAIYGAVLSTVTVLRRASA